MWELINGRWIAKIGPYTLSSQDGTWAVDVRGMFLAFGYDETAEVGKRKALAAMREVIAELVDATDRLEQEVVNV